MNSTSQSKKQKKFKHYGILLKCKAIIYDLIVYNQLNVDLIHI